MTKRIGLLVPSSNTVMEVDFYRSLPSSVTVHTGRMYMESTTVEGEEKMLDAYATCNKNSRIRIQFAADGAQKIKSPSFRTSVRQKLR